MRLLPCLQQAFCLQLCCSQPLNLQEMLLMKGTILSYIFPVFIILALFIYKKWFNNFFLIITEIQNNVSRIIIISASICWLFSYTEANSAVYMNLHLQMPLLCTHTFCNTACNWRCYLLNSYKFFSISCSIIFQKTFHQISLLYSTDDLGKYIDR